MIPGPLLYHWCCVQEAVDVVMETMPNTAHLLGNFMDNHDMPRLASYKMINSDLIL